MEIFYKIFFAFRFRVYYKYLKCATQLFFKIQGMKFGKNVNFSKFYVTWPHKVSIGSDCVIEHGVFFKHDGIWSKDYSILIGNNVFIGANTEFNVREKVVIGDDSLIASGCKFIDHDHGMSLDKLMRVQAGLEKEIVIGKNVWLGANVIVLKGVRIGEGAIVAAGAVVTKSIPSNEVWGGIPAKKINERS